MLYKISCPSFSILFTKRSIWAGVVGLNEAIKFINGLGVSNIKSHEDSLLHHLTEKLIKIDGLKIYGSSQNKAAILSFNIDGLHHYDIGVKLTGTLRGPRSPCGPTSP